MAVVRRTDFTDVHRWYVLATLACLAVPGPNTTDCNDGVRRGTSVSYHQSVLNRSATTVPTALNLLDTVEPSSAARPSYILYPSDVNDGYARYRWFTRPGVGGRTCTDMDYP